MTTEIEKIFFDTFGIEPYDRYLNCTENLEVDCNRNCNYCDKAEDVYCYPQITDTHYLKLICILSKELRMIFRISSENLEDIKKEILQKSISNYYCYSDELAPNHQWFYEYEHQVRTLFEEVN